MDYEVGLWILFPCFACGKTTKHVIVGCYEGMRAVCCSECGNGAIIPTNYLLTQLREF